MVYEVVVYTVEPARRAEFIDVYTRALHAAHLGYNAGRVLSSIEEPGRVVVILEWDSVEAHTRHRGTDYLQRFVDTIKPYAVEPWHLNHYTYQDL